MSSALDVFAALMSVLWIRIDMLNWDAAAPSLLQSSGFRPSVEVEATPQPRSKLRDKNILRCTVCVRGTAYFVTNDSELQGEPHAAVGAMRGVHMRLV